MLAPQGTFTVVELNGVGEARAPGTSTKASDDATIITRQTPMTPGASRRERRRAFSLCRLCLRSCTILSPSSLLIDSPFSEPRTTPKVPGKLAIASPHPKMGSSPTRGTPCPRAFRARPCLSTLGWPQLDTHLFTPSEKTAHPVGKNSRRTVEDGRLTGRPILQG